MVARFLIPALMAAMLPAAAANAAVVLGAGGVSSTVFTFDGLTSMASGAQVAGTDRLDARLTLTLTDGAGLGWSLRYRVENLAGGSWNDARIVGFGFDIAADPLLAGSSGRFDRTDTGEVFSGFSTDLCFMDSGGGCDGNGGGLRVSDGASAGDINLFFLMPQTAITLSNVYVKWRDAELDKKSAPPPVSVVEMQWEPAPEPATWAMMLAGFGLVGTALRRNRATAAA